MTGGAGLFCRLWRLYGVVRKLCRGGHVQPVPSGQISGQLGEERMACDPGLCGRVLYPVCAGGMASAPSAQGIEHKAAAEAEATVH